MKKFSFFKFHTKCARKSETSKYERYDYKDKINENEVLIDYKSQYHISRRFINTHIEKI